MASQDAHALLTTFRLVDVGGSTGSLIALSSKKIYILASRTHFFCPREMLARLSYLSDGMQLPLAPITKCSGHCIIVSSLLKV